MAGVTQPTAEEIVEITKKDYKTWEMYSKGYTVGLNQCERQKSTERIMRYKPRNIIELSAFIAAIRPAFQSMLEIFLTRQRFSFGIQALDSILQTPEMASSFLLYQEQVFTILMKAGISGSDAYKVIKAISKKKTDVIHSYMEQFMEGFSPYVMADGKTTSEEAQSAAARVWKVVEDSAAYSFNLSHSYCVALDSLYSAYLKAHYPYEFYTAALRIYGQKQDKERLGRIKNEMRQAFGIGVAPPRFGQDNRDFFIDKDARTISDALPSVKYMSRLAAEDLYQLGQVKWASFVDVLRELTINTCIDKRETEILIKMGYFRQFGNEGKLLTLFEEFNSGKYRITKSLKPKTQDDRMEVLRAVEEMTDGEPMSIQEKMKFETEYFGSPVSTYPNNKSFYTVISIDTQYSPKLYLYNVSNGNTGRMKMRKAAYNAQPLEAGDTISIMHWERKPSFAYVNGKSIMKKDEYELWIEVFKKVS